MICCIIVGQLKCSEWLFKVQTKCVRNLGCVIITIREKKLVEKMEEKVTHEGAKKITEKKKENIIEVI